MRSVGKAYNLVTRCSSCVYCLLPRRSFAMNEKGPIPLTVTSPPDSRWELVLRVADSIYFRKGPKLRAFLLYVCENTILGRVNNVREQLIGSKVFGRPTDYSLSDDNIVRVEARELRKRLGAYFANEGQAEPVIIEIPKGAYVPIFRPRVQAAPGLETEVDDAIVGAVDALPAKVRPGRWLTWALATGLLVSTAATLWLLMENRRLQPLPSPPGAVAGEDYSIYDDLLGTLGRLHNHETQLVLGNPKVIVFFGSMTPTSYWAAEPGSSAVPAPKDLDRIFSSALNGKDREMPFHFFQITGQTYTGTGEATAAFNLGRLMDLLNRPVHITQARFINWDNVQEQDMILMGGPSSNDWTNRVEPRTDFIFSERSVLNLRPLPGEQKEYTLEEAPPGGGAMAEYGFIKMHTTANGFRTLLLAGLSSAGTAGVTEFFATPAKMKAVAGRIAAAVPGKPFPYDWQVLVRITVQDGLPIETSAVTIRPLPPVAR